MRMKNKGGFTLLEIIIVIIIIGVLASLALPRLFSTVEFSRSAEALASFATIRGALERCYLMNNSTYVGCTLTAAGTSLDIENPSSAPNAHFTYLVSGQTTTGYTITANRTTRNGGTVGHLIVLTQSATSVTRTGTGAFSAIK